MIIEYDFAQDILEKIEEELESYEENQKIAISDFSPTTVNTNYERIYKSQLFCLPIFSRESTEIIQLNKYYFEIFFNGIKREQPKLVEQGVDKSIKSEMINCYPPSTIHAAIVNKVRRLVFEYEKVLEATIEENNLYGIKDEERVLKNHLKKYYELLESNSKQIEFLRGIILNKKISDLILKIYIRFITSRLNMLNPVDFKTGELPREGPISKIVWKGNQKELCELFIELQRKGWIEEFGYGKISKSAKAICSLFDLTLTQKGMTSSVENSFYQILKGKTNPKTKEREYDEIFGKNYELKFEEIKENGC